MKIVNSQTVKIGGMMLAGILLPGAAFACACGCSIFDVATSSMFPEQPGGMAFLNYGYQDQNRNWSGDSSAPAENNDDRKIETHFVTLGLQYTFNRNWSAQVQLPYDFRNFKGVDDDGNLVNRRWNSLGDIRLNAIYTGLSDDLSSGLTLGIKLPTGSDGRFSDVVERDTQIGTGSTDILLGAFHRGRFGDSHFSWFGQVEGDIPALKEGGYRPGMEADTAWGIYYEGLSLGRAHISPLAQVIATWHGRDCGSDADFSNTGYERLFVSPGIEIDLHPVKIYADVEFAVYQHVNGNQVVAPALFKLSMSYMF